MFKVMKICHLCGLDVSIHIQFHEHFVEEKLIIIIKTNGFTLLNLFTDIYNGRQ